MARPCSKVNTYRLVLDPFSAPYKSGPNRQNQIRTRPERSGYDKKGPDPTRCWSAKLAKINILYCKLFLRLLRSNYPGIDVDHLCYVDHIKPEEILLLLPLTTIRYKSLSPWTHLNR
jgi:hypothetical protein